MTKEEIKEIISQKIEGQGANLDAASVLPTILNWIIDNMPEGGIPVASATRIGGMTIGNINHEHALQMGAAPYHSLLFINLGEGEDKDRLGFRVLGMGDLSNHPNLSKEELAGYLGINVSEVDSIFYGGFIGMRLLFSGEESYYLPLTCASGRDRAIFGGYSPDDYGCVVVVEWNTNTDLYSIRVFEI